MSRSDRRSDGGVTIVGGRPLHRAVEAASLPLGVEQALAVAALNRGFRRELLADPQGAAARRGIVLDDLDVSLLRSVPPETLAALAERAVVPPDAGRRGFVKAVSASVIALVTGGGYLLCAGCTGADGWDSRDWDSGGPPSDGEDTGGGASAGRDTGEDTGVGAAPGPRYPFRTIQEWHRGAGRDYYLYLPVEAQRRLAAERNDVGHLVALHGEGEDCLSQVQRWYRTADEEGIVVVSVNWEPKDDDPAPLAHDVCLISGEVATAWPCVHGRMYCFPRVICGRGAAAPAVWKAAFEEPYTWYSVLLLGGLPVPADATDVWVSPNDPKRLYWVMGEDDPERPAAEALAPRLEAAGLTVRLHLVPGTTDRAKLDLGAIWAWLAAT